MIVQVVLLVVTFGIYSVYWFYQTSSELKFITKDSEAAPTIWTLLLFVPFGNIYAFYKYSELFEKVSSEKVSKWVLFLLWLCFSPAIWFLVQRDLNNLAAKPVA